MSVFSFRLSLISSVALNVGSSVLVTKDPKILCVSFRFISRLYWPSSFMNRIFVDLIKCLLAFSMPIFDAIFFTDITQFLALLTKS